MPLFTFSAVASAPSMLTPSPCCSANRAICSRCVRVARHGRHHDGRGVRDGGRGSGQINLVSVGILFLDAEQLDERTPRAGAVLARIDRDLAGRLVEADAPPSVAPLAPSPLPDAQPNSPNSPSARTAALPPLPNASSSSSFLRCALRAHCFPLKHGHRRPAARNMMKTEHQNRVGRRSKVCKVSGGRFFRAGARSTQDPRQAYARTVLETPARNMESALEAR